MAVMRLINFKDYSLSQSILVVHYQKIEETKAGPVRKFTSNNGTIINAVTSKN